MLGFEMPGQKGVAPDTYGDEYTAEYRRLLRAHVTQPGARLLEWGSGLTTQMAAEHAEAAGAALLVSVDHTRDYVRALARRLPRRDFLHLWWADLNGAAGLHGPAYSTLPLRYGPPFDFILVDGRRRLECALVAARLVAPGGVVVLHDHYRERYRLFDSLFEPVEVKRQFKVMRVRPAVAAALAQPPASALAAGWDAPPDPAVAQAIGTGA